MKRIVQTDNAPAAIGPYSQAVAAGGMLFISGQIPLDAKSGQLVGESTGEQTRQVLKNLLAILESEGLGFKDVVRTTIFLKSMNDFVEVNEVYGEAFKDARPARATVEVSRLPKDVRVEIDAIALMRDASKGE